MSRSLPHRLYRIHAWAGLFGGVFLVIICVSGGVLVFKPAIQRAADWNGYAFDVTPTASGPVSADAALRAFKAERPGARPLRLWLPALDDSSDSNAGTYWITAPAGKDTGGKDTAGKDAGGKDGAGTGMDGKEMVGKDTATKGAADRFTDFLVDPYRGVVIARTRLNDGWGFWLRQVHLRLLYGQFWGRWVVGAFGVALAVATATGLLIYLRFNGGVWTPKMRRGRGLRVLLADWHKVVGVGSLAFNLLFGVTGAYLGLETIYDRYFAAKTPALTRDAPALAVQGATFAADRSDRLAACLAAAGRLLPGATPVGIDFTYGNRPALHVRVSYPARTLIQEGSGGVTFDAATGAVLRVRDMTAESLAVRAAYAAEPLHFGRLGGYLWVKLLWLVMGLSGGVLSITGYGIYVARAWKKRNARRAMAGRALVAA